MSTLEGLHAPDFTLQNEDGSPVTLSDYEGKKYVILYFYPKDATPGCTLEAQSFKENHSEFSALNAVILGVSPDGEASHIKFINKHGLPFSLLADTEQTVSKLYGVWKLKKTFGKEYMGIERSTFLIDPTGTVIKEWRKVKVDGHIDAVHQTLLQVSNEGTGESL
ncbi:thioredoxin-dependent thiol peroxidase [Sporosarcina aquimarina]|uniref:thioredoxin-dependent thiol peroxidase n=1 Tax=Sporosarcina aquimarina TaxID=114975 RepID=UPI00203ABE6F|nr:thioredoxin-dependent thiol peroxidase [Sporosarcina aquimarina]MCM3759060.1 thioredoxin-dependent thiol peroxidase [Sporosarcina aquimarina]